MGEGTTPVTTACPEAGKYKCEEKKNHSSAGHRAEISGVFIYQNARGRAFVLFCVPLVRLGR